MFKVGDRVQLSGNPWDDQIPEEEMMFIFLASQIMTVVRISKPDDLDAPATDEVQPEGTWIKTDMIPDWISPMWFKKVEE